SRSAPPSARPADGLRRTCRSADRRGSPRAAPEWARFDDGCAGRPSSPGFARRADRYRPSTQHGGDRMSGAATNTPGAIPVFKQTMGHPRPLWMLFMTEFWERFAFYGIRWALTLYIVQAFYAGSGEGEAPASRVYGAYLALVYAAAIIGGYIADRVIGYQRSILLGAVVMSAGLFMIAWPDQTVFHIGLATVIAGNGLFKPNISAMVGKLYAPTDERRDSGFTLFYMGINAGAFIAPILTGWLSD